MPAHGTPIETQELCAKSDDMPSGHKGPKKAPFKVVPLGCSLQELWAPMDGGNICLGFRDSEHQLATGNPAFFGETIGKVANLISDGRLKNVNGRDYNLPCSRNYGNVTLHGGDNGWGKQVWKGPRLEWRRDSCGRICSNVQKFTCLSPHGDQGFPGHVEARAWWFTWDEEDKTVVEVEYEAELLEEQPEGVEETVISMTNYACFNLSPTCHCDDLSISSTILTLTTTSHLILSEETGLPTGDIAASYPPEMQINANEEFLLATTVPKLDDCFIFPCTSSSVMSIPIDTRAQQLKKCLTMMHPKTAIYLEIWTTEPAFQVNSGDRIDVDAGNGVVFQPRSGIAVAPGRYMDASTKEEWRGMVTVRKGECFGSRIRYVVWKSDWTRGP